jgi:hypothetical protein
VPSAPPLNTSSINSTAGLDWLDISEDASPQGIFRAIGRLRKEARDEIDPLIRFLDETDNHMEREPEDEGDDAEDEPSLASLDRPSDQTQWAKGSCDDTEHEHDGREPGEDDEPSLCGGGWSRDTTDREIDDGESGIGDLDGLLEQVGSEDWRAEAMV